MGTPTQTVFLLVTLCLRLPQTHLLSKLPIPDSQVITINPELPVEEAAEDYAKKLRQVSAFEWLQGDLIYLVATPQVTGATLPVALSDHRWHKLPLGAVGRVSLTLGRSLWGSPSGRATATPWRPPKMARPLDTLEVGLGLHILGTVVSLN